MRLNLTQIFRMHVNINGEKMSRIIGYCIIAIMASVFEAHASSVVPASGHSARLVSNTSMQDMLYIAPPNSAGVSINQFSRFEVNAPLLLMNTPSYDATTGAPISSAKTVVLIANNFSLATAIEIVGPATDLVIITNSSSGNIQCRSCSFTNVLRLSLISNESKTLNSQTLMLGDFKASGTINISGLTAPGALALDILAGTLSTAGEINLNQLAMPHHNGGYAATPNGKYVMGTGSLELISGSLTWNYEKDQIKHVGASSRTLQLNGVFKAPRVSVSSSDNLRINARLDTRVNVISAISYHGITHIPQEGVVIQALSKETGVDVVLAGDIYSDNTVDLRATRDLRVENSTEITALKVAGVAGRLAVTNGSVQGEIVSLAGAEINNEGVLEATKLVQLWAERDLANQYGGVIRAPEVVLDSATTVVRNGSRTPYRTESSNRNNLFNLGASEALAALEHNVEFNPYTLDSSQLGAYYLLPGGMLVVNDGSVSMPIKQTAHIIGKTILVRAPAFENINPYYVRVADQEEVLLDRERVNQVMVSAETLLEIQGAEGSINSRSEYMINSSGLLTLNSKSGKLRVQSKRLINNRYRISTYLQKNEAVISAASCDQYGRVSSTSTKVDTEFSSFTAVYSPPGFISVFGHAEMNATIYFANLMGYFEAFSGANINSVQLKNFGLENQGVARSVTENSRQISFRRKKINFNAAESNVFAKDPRELDSLFYVSGELKALDADAWFGALNPFHYFLGEALASREADIIPLIGHHIALKDNYCPHEYERVEGDDQYYSGCTRKEFVSGSLSIKINPQHIVANANNDQIEFQYEVDVLSKEYYVDPVYHPNQTPTATRVDTVAGSNSISLFETLEKYYQKVKEKLAKMLSEFDWWGLAA